MVSKKNLEKRVEALEATVQAERQARWHDSFLRGGRPSLDDPAYYTGADGLSSDFDPGMLSEDYR